MNFLRKIFQNEEKYVGLCSVKRANKNVPYIRTIKHRELQYFKTNITNNVYLAV